MTNFLLLGSHKQTGDKHSYRGRDLVVFHSDNYLELYGKPSSLFDCRADDYSNRECGRSSGSTRNNLRNTWRWLNDDILSCEYLKKLLFFPDLVLLSDVLFFLATYKPWESVIRACIYVIVFSSTTFASFVNSFCFSLKKDSKIGIYQKMWRFMEVSSSFSFPNLLYVYER